MGSHYLNNKCFSNSSVSLSRDITALAELKEPIPECEMKCIQLLREAHLLDSGSLHDGDYARLSNLATRIFKVPIALVQNLFAQQHGCSGAYVRPKMVRCDLDALVRGVSPLISALNPQVSESRWTAPLRDLSRRLESQGRRLFCFPEVLSLALCRLVACDGACGAFNFETLSLSLATTCKEQKCTAGYSQNLVQDADFVQHEQCGWDSGELVVSLAHSFVSHGMTAEERERKLDHVRASLDSLREVLQWVGGALNVSFYFKLSSVVVELRLPFLSVAIRNRRLLSVPSKVWSVGKYEPITEQSSTYTAATDEHSDCDDECQFQSSTIRFASALANSSKRFPEVSSPKYRKRVFCTWKWLFGRKKNSCVLPSE